MTQDEVLWNVTDRPVLRALAIWFPSGKSAVTTKELLPEIGWPISGRFADDV